MENIIKKYITEKKDEHFLLIYENVADVRRDKIRYFSSKGFAEHEIIEGLDEALLESIHNWKHEKSDFKTFYRNCADLRIIDVRRRTLRRNEWEVYEPDEDFSEEGEEEYIEFTEQDIRVDDFPSVEKEVIDKKEKEKEQRQLFYTILNDSDEKLRQQLLVIAEGRSANYAARKFKMHHQTLNRKLSRLSRKYSDQWSDLSLYA